MKRYAAEGKTPKETALLMNVKYHTLYPHWKREKLPMQGSGGFNRIITSNPFLVWDEKAQYWFGYLLGDGNVSKKKYSIGIYSQDIDHLTKYSEWLGNLKVHISKGGRSSKGTVVFGHKPTHQWLISQGIIPNKSLSVELRCEFTPHIVRGLFDADGCGRKKANPSKITSGSPWLLLQLQRYFDKCGICTVIHLQCNNTYCICIKRKSDSAFYDLLYTNATVYLERKEQRLKDACASKIG